MSRRVVFAVGGVILGLILLNWIPWYVTVLIIAAAIAIPVGGYLMLDSSQRRRLRSSRRRSLH